MCLQLIKTQIAKVPSDKLEYRIGSFPMKGHIVGGQPCTNCIISGHILMCIAGSRTTKALYVRRVGFIALLSSLPHSA